MRYTDEERAAIMRKWGFSQEPLVHPRAEKMLRRLADAIELGTVHRHRLTSLHEKLQREVETGDARLVDWWLAEMGAGVNAEINQAFDTFERELAQQNMIAPGRYA